MMTENEIKEMKAIASYIDREAHNMNLSRRWEMLKRAGMMLEQAYATIRELQEKVREWPQN